MTEQEMPTFKLVLVGDGGVGKVSLKTLDYIHFRFFKSFFFARPNLIVKKAVSSLLIVSIHDFLRFLYKEYLYVSLKFVLVVKISSKIDNIVRE